MAINEDQESQIFFNTQGSMREADSESNVAYSAPDFGKDYSWSPLVRDELFQYHESSQLSFKKIMNEYHNDNS
jgi:hypothetical protein